MLSKILISSIIGSLLFLLLLCLKLVVGKKFSTTFHYYSRIIPIAFYFGVAWVFAPLVSFFAKLPFVDTNAVDIYLSKGNSPVDLASPFAAIDNGVTVMKGSIIQATSTLNLTEILEYLLPLWAVGMVCFLFYKFFAYSKFKKFLIRNSIPFEGNIRGVTLFLCDCITTPILLGIGKPTIILPNFAKHEMSEKELELILAHEMIHVKRRDL